MADIIDLASKRKETAPIEEDPIAASDPLLAKAEPKKFEDLPAPMQRALLEAEERRKQQELAEQASKVEKEINGRGGLDPIRYGDWEAKGITSDF
jgi:hypothetical protein